MKSFFDNVPEIIKAAASSPLGLFALMILALAFLAFFFFRKASERTRISIFVLMFCGVIVFGFAISDEMNKPKPNGIKQEKVVDKCSIPEGSLVKGSSGKVYVIENKKRRWIFTYGGFVRMGFSNGKIKLISDEQLNNCPEGTPLYEGSLLKGEGTKVYLIQDKKRRWITSLSVLKRYNPNDVEIVSDNILNSFPEGDPIQ